MVQDLSDIGIKVELVQQDFDVLIGTITTPHAAPLVFIGWFQDFPDPSDFYDPIFSCAANVPGGASYGWYCNKDADALAAHRPRQRQDSGASRTATGTGTSRTWSWPTCRPCPCSSRTRWCSSRPVGRRQPVPSRLLHRPRGDRRHRVIHPGAGSSRRHGF